MKLNVLQALCVNIYCEASAHVLAIHIISVHFQATKGYTCSAYDVAFDDVAFYDVAFDDVAFYDVAFDDVAIDYVAFDCVALMMLRFVSTEMRRLDDYIKHYEELSYSTQNLHNKHMRAKRSTGSKSSKLTHGKR